MPMKKLKQLHKDAILQLGGDYRSSLDQQPVAGQMELLA